MAIRTPSTRAHQSKATEGQMQSLVRLNIEITHNQRRELKQIAMDQDISMRELVTNILTGEIAKDAKKKAKAIQ